MPTNVKVVDFTDKPKSKEKLKLNILNSMVQEYKNTDLDLFQKIDLIILKMSY